MSTLQIEINNTIEALKRGEIILYPTDTIWGIGCDATNEEAVKKIYKLKGRDESKSMIILIDESYKIDKYIAIMPDFAYELIDYSTKPITIIYPKAKNLAKYLIADDGSIAIRVTKNEFCKKVIAKFGKPIVSTSANISGKIAPRFFDEISDEIINNVNYVVDLNRSDKIINDPSTIIKLEEKGQFKIIRN